MISPVIADAVVLSADQCSTGAALARDGSAAAAVASSEVTRLAIGTSDQHLLSVASIWLLLSPANLLLWWLTHQEAWRRLPPTAHTL